MSSLSVLEIPTSFNNINTALRRPFDFWTEEMRRHDVAVLNLGANKSVTVFSPDLIQDILLDKSGCFKRSEVANRLLVPALGEGLLTIDGEKWRSHRKIITQAFRHDALCGLLPTICQSADVLVQRLTDTNAKDTEIVQEMTRTTFDIIQGMLFGKVSIPYDQDAVLRDVSRYLKAVGNISVLDFVPIVSFFARLRHYTAFMAANRFRNLAQEAIQIIREQPPEEREVTLSGLLIDAQETNKVPGFTNEHVIDNVITFVGAGHETTSIALSWALSLLLENPNVWSELVEEERAIPDSVRDTHRMFDYLSLHERVIQEAMRLFPPVPQIARNVRKQTTLGPLSLRPGDHVTIGIEPIHKSEKLWESPEYFNPDRFLPENREKHHRFQYMPFGGGQHICIGMKLALWEALIILSRLTRNFEIIQASQTVPIQRTVNVTMRPEHGFYMKFKRQ